jgi:Protein of unknown function (DUF3047)
LVAFSMDEAPSTAPHHPTTMPCWICIGARTLLAGLSLVMAACVGTPPLATPAPALVTAEPSASWPSAWQPLSLPGKPSTQYTRVRMDGREAVLASAVSSASLLRQSVHIPASGLDHIRFSWKVPELIAQADLAVREHDDSPVRIVLAFDGDRSRFSAKNAMLSELAHVMTGEPMPYATLMYVWCNTRPPGSVVINPRTDRIRKIVVESGSQNLNQWRDYERDIRADFEKAFGEAPGALVGVAIMTDTDNTRTNAQAWYGKVTLGAAH